MKNVKMVTRIILGLIASFFLIILSVLLIMKSTILNKDYVIKKISDDNYYDKLYEVHCRAIAVMDCEDAFKLIFEEFTNLTECYLSQTTN